MMRIPLLGLLDFKSLIIGAVLAYFVLPRIMAFVTNLRSGSTSQS
jgi:hypothetical protein